jgi:HAE1 family hydrophobic/amphiphilic exporter-1
MNVIKLAIERPVAVLSVVLIVVLMGWVALKAIPIQLTPDLRKPLIQVRTQWKGAAPIEVEREIVDRQEEALKGLEGLDEMSSSSQDGRSFINLEFSIETNMDRSLLLVGNRLNTITGAPREADEPRINTRDSDDNPVAWFVVKLRSGNTRDVRTYFDYVEDVIEDRLERVNGVALVNVFGGSERELQVIVDPQRMARYGLTVSDVAGVLRSANANVSAGDLDEGKRRYIVRTEAELTDIAKVQQVVLRSRVDPATGRHSRVTVGDIATVQFGFKKATRQIRNLGRNAIVVNAVRETGANVMDVMAGLRKAVEELNKGPLPRAGIELQQVYDETIYISSAIELVNSNIFIGGTLAALLLLLFLRSPRATLVISLAIPVSVVGSFVAMAALGRSINVISLAGIAFAVGMVVDAAIVVLENIYRLRQLGHSRSQAAYRGAVEVWGAILVSAATTIAVFVPILIMKLEVGQLFRDIAVAISVAVVLSLIVSVTVIPTLAAKLFAEGTGSLDKRMRLPLIDDFAELFVRVVTGITRGVINSKIAALLLVGVICGAAGGATWAFLPKLEYLPEGNRNLVIGFLVPPPGYNLSTISEIATGLESETRKMWASETGPESKPDEPPKMDRFWFIALPARTIIAASAVDPQRASELVPILRRIAFREPGTFGFINQTSLFGRGFGGSRVVDLDISGPDMEENLEVARRATQLINQAMPRSEGTQLRPRPGLELGGPEVRVVPDPTRLADAGITARELGETVDAFNDGLRVAEVTVDARRIDLTLRGPQNRILQTQGINYLPVVTRSGTILPAGELAKVEVTEGPTEIRHRDRQRTVTLQIRPAGNIPLETALDIIRKEVIDELTKQGLPPGIVLGMSGTADKLQQTWDAMVWNLIIALAVVYLVMAILFESFVYPFIIMFSVPLATAGGVAGLAILNLFTFNPLDMLTLLGFIILIGIVVNNAILLVHQTLFLVREENYDVSDAILESTQNRIRPIFMSTLTSVCGMLPLVLFPGAGSELYRGLGSVVVGGLALSAVLTLLIIPPLLSVIAGTVEGRKAHGRAARAATQGAPAE